VLVTLNGVRTIQHPRLVSSAKAQRDLGASFRSLAETLRDEVAWFRANQPERLRGSVAAARSPSGA
jgi:hypothetical protein